VLVEDAAAAGAGVRRGHIVAEPILDALHGRNYAKGAIDT
jgi:hypothetical protein